MAEKGANMSMRTVKKKDPLPKSNNSAEMSQRNVKKKDGAPKGNEMSLRIVKKKDGNQKTCNTMEQSSRMVKKKDPNGAPRTCNTMEQSSRMVKKKGGEKTCNTNEMSVKKVKKVKKPVKKPNKREKMYGGEMIKSEVFNWKVDKLLGSGGFGDVYKVTKQDNSDKREFAMKTEMAEGDKRMLRLKIEVTVLKACHEIADPEKKKHFVEFVDRGLTDKFKFLVMSLVGPSLEDIRKAYLMKNYSKPTAMNASIQTLQAMKDLHQLGWLHRDIKPQNYAVGLGDKEELIYMLDFGIARKIFKGDTAELKQARAAVKFLGTLRFASRACHHGTEQGRKDDLETWLYMAFDLLDQETGLPWKRAADRAAIVGHKEKFFKHGFVKAYRIVPIQFKKIVDYLNGLNYQDEPDYRYIEESLVAICKDNRINHLQKMDWAGKLAKKADQEDSETSTDNKQSGSAEDDEEEKKAKAKGELSMRKRKQ